MNIYPLGSQVKCWSRDPAHGILGFTDTNTGTLVDPPTVHFVCQPPTGAVIRAAWTNGSGTTQGIITRDSAGVFFTTLDLDLPHIWTYRWYSDTPYKAGAQNQLQVEEGIH